jgi:glycosyltransferase involved in cell wall biosynthesis
LPAKTVTANMAAGHMADPADFLLMPSVSIALATFNGEKYLGPQLESLARQTLLPCELVVTDDRSEDGTTDIVRAFAAHARFPVRLQENPSRLGYRANFMQAADLCVGDLIAYCDQDDIWEPDKLAVMQRMFDDPDVLLAYHNASVIDENGGLVGHFYKPGSGIHRFAPLATDPWSLVAGFTQVFRRGLSRFSALRAASIDPYWPAEHLAHDQWQLFLASVLGSLARVAQPLARYRQHGDNTFGWEDAPWLETAPGHFLRAESFIAAARNRIELLRRMSADLNAGEQARVQAAIVFYEDLQRRLDDRISMYSSAALMTRAKAFRALLRQRAYSHALGSARFGWKGLLMDGFGGVPFGPILKRIL